MKENTKNSFFTHDTPHISNEFTMTAEEKFGLIFDMDIIKKYCEEHKSEFETWKKERKDAIEDEVST